MLKLSATIISGIRDDRTQGASQLAGVALEGILDVSIACTDAEPVQFRETLMELVSELKQVRPSMLVIANLLEIWEEQFELIYHGHKRQLVNGVVDMTRALMDQLARASNDCARHMAALVEPGEVIMTHSLSSTVKLFFSCLQSKTVSAIITESRPLREGILLAEYLSALAVETTLITESQMGLWCQRATRIVTGADCILSDGSVVNKAGTFLLALAAKEYGVPFYTCCESYKQVKISARELKLEEMQASELGAADLPHVHPRNIYFDITPARYVTGWVTESGVKNQW